jgi:hypothetical protein
MMMKKFRSVPLARRERDLSETGFCFGHRSDSLPYNEPIPLPLRIDGNPRLVIHDFDLAQELDVPEANQFLNPAFLADSFPKEYITS